MDTTRSELDEISKHKLPIGVAVKVAHNSTDVGITIADTPELTPSGFKVVITALDGDIGRSRKASDHCGDQLKNKQVQFHVDALRDVGWTSVVSVFFVCSSLGKPNYEMKAMATLV